MISSKLKKEVSLIKTNLKKNDIVRVIAGREKGKEGKVLQVVRERHTILVEQVNLIKKHVRPTQKSPKGGIIEREGMLQISNVMILCQKCSRPSRIAMKVFSDDKKIRTCHRCGEFFDKE
ncbi:MAG: 50S ribosomal protein L24 [Nitrospirota bacterium]